MVSLKRPMLRTEFMEKS